MNTFSHLKIGRILYESLVEDARGLLSYRAFLWGNISPDFSVRLLTCPHYIENYSSFLKEELAFLFDGGDAESAFWADTYGEDWPANAFLMHDSDVPNPEPCRPPRCCLPFSDGFFLLRAHERLHRHDAGAYPL